MKYEYKMIQAAPHVIAQKKNTQTAAADYLQALVDEHAAQGWEFFRIDDFSTEEAAGCFSGGKQTTMVHKVITFRREKI
ncbi:DUF4177 domain-containing protein [Pasteurella multocida subsp. multocida]|uniref:DUF4177 domain-containing protein n=1 Tax=Pasteurella multocida TaxID=747 RepID=A0A9X3USF6_PASMD|nr:DUF4177 domain-containing protein [Pasteurella multocida]MBF6979993.1 DUF4177 domain-containing protein [Pasteurella multocida]MDA5618297.1 DUF4177 domain-containing protein [Pasteurella multocida subsp. multocida]MDA5619983.1 DUF4177 domain-containing protein [Pasteurella multocida subsp. multocida]MDA5622689.1 DUF4177 domain-containing protein [Pasteurella multocida]QDA14311.1 DUF4177 domain-containing protein [Pasteurella multocida subsp. multocida]